MTAYTGSALYVTLGGTVAQANYRSLEINDEIGLEDASAGSDVGRSYLSTLKDGDATLTLRSISGTAGTAIWLGWTSGANGTLVFHPEGTATGKIKGSVYAYIESRETPMEYDQVAEWTFNLKFSDTAGITYTTN